jgi:amidohydrolase
MLNNEVKRLAEGLFGRAVADRRHLHAHPELSFAEYETASYVKTRLGEMGIPWESMAGTGVVGMITGDKPSDGVIALRADMDALPIEEVGDRVYASKNKGVMHACGHDAHTASLLGTAGILNALKQRFGGVVKLIFQPGEEKMPGGASLMLKEGVMEQPRPGAIVGQHVMPEIVAGKIGIRSGRHMASMDELYVRVSGRGGHGAQPHLNIDPVLIAAHLIVALQQIVSRVAQPRIPTVLSFGRVIANGSVNVIPDEVYIEGTFRTMDEAWRTEAHGRMKEMAAAIATGMGGNCDFQVIRGYPCLINEEKLTARLRGYAEEYLGVDNVVDADVWMAAEDFAYYSRAADSCFYLLGTGGSAKTTRSSLHTCTFDIDEDALALSTGLMAYIALKCLDN